MTSTMQCSFISHEGEDGELKGEKEGGGVVSVVISKNSLELNKGIQEMLKSNFNSEQGI